MRAPECILTREAVADLLDDVLTMGRPVRIKRSIADADGVMEEWSIGSRLFPEWCHLFRRTNGDRIEVTFSIGSRGWFMEEMIKIVGSHPRCEWVYPTK